MHGSTLHVRRVASYDSAKCKLILIVLNIWKKNSIHDIVLLPFLIINYHYEGILYGIEHGHMQV